MFSYLAYQSNLFALGFTFLAAIVACILAGTYVGNRQGRTHVETGFTVSQAAVLGLSGLILAFSFNAAAARFELRQNLVGDEAGAIETAYLRGDLLPTEKEAPYRAAMRAYTEQRIEEYSLGADQIALLTSWERDHAAQAVLWKIGSRTAEGAPRNVELVLVTQALNQMFDAGLAEEAALRNRVPGSILALVVIVTLLSAFLDGIGFAASGRRFVTGTMVAVLLTMVLVTIFDLDRPQQGFVRVDLTALKLQLQDMK
ncbi:MAG: hypothetical protein ACLQPV_07015 [Vulcanimicrobiaceae bacterium]